MRYMPTTAAAHPRTLSSACSFFSNLEVFFPRDDSPLSDSPPDCFPVLRNLGMLKGTWRRVHGQCTAASSEGKGEVHAQQHKDIITSMASLVIPRAMSLICPTGSRICNVWPARLASQESRMHVSAATR